jgi:CheY-like chemotaxis protein
LPVGQPETSAKVVVLVVEDEPLLRLLAVDMVENGGFEALEADGANEAIRILEVRLDIRIVFTDIDMPMGVDGLSLAAIIRDRWPPIAIIITSGKTTVFTRDMPEGGVFFPKPYLPEEVMAAMHKMAA